MRTLRELLGEPNAFLCGFELVSTRGTLEEHKAVAARELARSLADNPFVHWISITDNAGGNPMLAPMALGKPLLHGGKEVLIHLSCKDFNRNGLESQAWQLASEGFRNILALSGDAPVAGYRGEAKPVFDLDSVGLLTMLDEMNRGLAVSRPAKSAVRRLGPTDFFTGAVTSTFKLRENELLPQLLKLEKKLDCGAQFLIAQVGYDSRKSHELLAYLRRRGRGQVPVIGNVFLLNPRVARVFHQGRIPGVVVTDELLELCQRQGASPDSGKSFFLEFAAKQAAIFRGLGYRGIYLGGIDSAQDLNRIMELERAFGPNDWKDFARQLCFSRPGEFFLLAKDPSTGLADEATLNPEYEASRQRRAASPNVTVTYRLSRWLHDAAFTPGGRLYAWAQKRYAKARNSTQGPTLLRWVEQASKNTLFGCRDCGDCSLPEIAFLCPESRCAKNQRNGPCGGTRAGRCEVEEFECIWARAYDRLKFEGRELDLLDFPPVLQNQALRGTSSWANLYLGRDHHAAAQALKQQAPTQPPSHAPSSTPNAWSDQTPPSAGQTHPNPPAGPAAGPTDPAHSASQICREAAASRQAQRGPE